MPTSIGSPIFRLRKHADYQRVYNSSRKVFAKQMTSFFSLRPPERRSDTQGPRIGLTVGKVLGRAVERNRIKRRLRELLRRHAILLGGYPVDVILHPRRTVLEMDAAKLEREVIEVFRTIRKALDRRALAVPAAAQPAVPTAAQSSAPALAGTAAQPSPIPARRD